VSLSSLSSCVCLQHSILVVLTNSGVPMVDAYSDRGNVIMKMTAEMVQMSWIVIIHHVLRKTSHVPTIAVYPCHRQVQLFCAEVLPFMNLLYLDFINKR
jgi:hypothetical protein